MIRLALTALCALPGAALAQTPEEAAAQNMQLAAELCLRNYRTEDQLGAVFQEAGFMVGPHYDEGVLEFQAPGVYGLFEEGYCFVQSPDVPLPTAEAIGWFLASRLFPGKVHEGGAERARDPLEPCEGLSIFAAQQLIRITYSAAGNSGDCIHDGSSSIIIQM